MDVGSPAYEGRNGAHSNFFGEFKYVNALYYVFVSAKNKLRAHIESAVADADRIAQGLGRSQARALGIVTRHCAAVAIWLGCRSKPTSFRRWHNFGTTSFTWSLYPKRMMPCRSDGSSTCPLTTIAIRARVS